MPRRPTKSVKRYIEHMPLDGLQPDPRNAKEHAENEIRAAMSRFGVIENVAVDERTGLLISGHGRRQDLLTRKASGEQPPEGIEIDGETWLVPVQRGWASKNEAEALAALIALNQIGPVGGWNDETLARQLDDMRKQDNGLVGVGFDTKQIDAMLAKLNVFPPGGDGKGKSEDVPSNYMVVIECKSEQQQTQLLDRFTAEGLSVRALLS